jgi:hypothetical protein
VKEQKLTRQRNEKKAKLSPPEPVRRPVDPPPLADLSEPGMSEAESLALLADLEQKLK